MLFPNARDSKKGNVMTEVRKSFIVHPLVSAFLEPRQPVEEKPLEVAEAVKEVIPAKEPAKIHHFAKAVMEGQKPEDVITGKFQIKESAYRDLGHHILSHYGYEKHTTELGADHYHKEGNTAHLHPPGDLGTGVDDGGRWMHTADGESDSKEGKHLHELHAHLHDLHHKE